MAVITISRQFGAGGRTIGKMVAERLGYRFVHEDIVKEIALKSKCSQEKIMDMHKKGAGKLLKFLSKVTSEDYVKRLTADDFVYIDESIYLDALQKVLLDLYHQNNIVIVGRAGQFILKGKENAYHVLMIASLAFRKRFLVENYNLSNSDAEKAVKRADEIRTRFLALFADVSQHEHPQNYHIVLNVEVLGDRKDCKACM